jgi:hypothetical protein
VADIVTRTDLPAPPPRNADGGRKLALVIANSCYDDAGLAGLAAPDIDIRGFADVLKDPAIGKFDEVIELLNRDSAVVRRAIARFFAQKRRDDLLLLYFSGHGIRNEQGHLFLAVKDTERSLLSGTGIEANFIAAQMDQSISKRQVLMLDCCHSGAFAYGAKSAQGVSVGTGTAFEGTGSGRVILTATDATQFAWEGDTVIGTADSSLFTHYVIQGLKTGEADLDADGEITIDELYDYVYDRVVSVTPKQTPGKWAYRQQGEIVIARNLAALAQAAALPSGLQDALASRFLSVRLEAILDLKELMQGRHAGRALSARTALEELARNDDSLKVRTAASEALASGGSQSAHVQVPAPPPAAPQPDDRAAQDRRAQNAVEEASRLFDAGNFQEALDGLERFDPPHALVSRVLDDLAALVDRNVQQRILIARTRFAETDLDGAKTDVDGALQIDPDHADAIELLKQVEAALVRRDRIASHVAAARSSVAREQFDHALAELDLARQLDPDADGLEELFIAATSGKARVEEAERVRRAVAKKIATASKLLTTDRYAEALALADEALADDARNAEAARLRQDAQRALDNQQRAEELERQERERRAAAREQAARERAAAIRKRRQHIVAAAVRTRSQVHALLNKGIASGLVLLAKRSVHAAVAGLLIVGTSWYAVGRLPSPPATSQQVADAQPHQPDVAPEPPPSVAPAPAEVAPPPKPSPPTPAIVPGARASDRQIAAVEPRPREQVDTKATATREPDRAQEELQQRVAALIRTGTDADSDQGAIAALRDALKLDPSNERARKLLDQHEAAVAHAANLERQRNLGAAVRQIEGRMAAGELDRADEALSAAEQNFQGSAELRSVRQRLTDLRERAKAEEAANGVQGVQHALAMYEAAYESRDAAAVLRIQPTFTAEQARQLANAFADYTSYQMSIEDARISMNGARATVSCRVVRAFTPKVGRGRTIAAPAVFQLERRTSGWVIVAVQ